MALSDIITMFNFIKNKLQVVGPNILARRMENHCPIDNIRWFEKFISTLFCVIKKNEAYKVIKVSDEKISNECEPIGNRTYLIKVEYNNKGKCVKRVFELHFNWRQLTRNDSKSFIGVLDGTRLQIDRFLTDLQASTTLPFLS